MGKGNGSWETNPDKMEFMLRKFLSSPLKGFGQGFTDKKILRIDINGSKHTFGTREQSFLELMLIQELSPPRKYLP